jgi:hypothetical protein
VTWLLKLYTPSLLLLHGLEGSSMGGLIFAIAMLTLFAGGAN